MHNRKYGVHKIYLITLEFTLLILFLKTAPEPVTSWNTFYVEDIVATNYKFPELPMSIFEPA